MLVLVSFSTTLCCWNWHVKMSCLITQCDLTLTASDWCKKGTKFAIIVTCWPHMNVRAPAFDTLQRMKYSSTVAGHIRKTAQKMKFSIKDFFSKCDQIRSFLCGFGHIYWKNSHWKLHFLYSDTTETFLWKIFINEILNNFKSTIYGKEATNFDSLLYIYCSMW